MTWLRAGTQVADLRELVWLTRELALKRKHGSLRKDSSLNSIIHAMGRRTEALKKMLAFFSPSAPPPDPPTFEQQVSDALDRSFEISCNLQSHYERGNQLRGFMQPVDIQKAHAAREWLKARIGQERHKDGFEQFLQFYESFGGNSQKGSLKVEDAIEIHDLLLAMRNQQAGLENGATGVMEDAGISRSISEE